MTQPCSRAANQHNANFNAAVKVKVDVELVLVVSTSPTCVSTNVLAWEMRVRMKFNVLAPPRSLFLGPLGEYRTVYEEITFCVCAQKPPGLLRITPRLRYMKTEPAASR